jgi:hypothetical protein
MRELRWTRILSLSVVAALAACGGTDSTQTGGDGPAAQSEQAMHASASPVGLSLWWQDGDVRMQSGAPKTVDLYEDFPRYVQEIDLTAHVDTATDQGLDPIFHAGDMKDLDWTGVHQVDEDYRPELGTNPPTYTRSRFYRGAKWMNRLSVFLVVPVDDQGHEVGPAILEVNGSDDKERPIDDGFVRRFDARQLTRGCRAIGDCTGATSFTAEGLVQVRDALHPTLRARKIPQAATQLKLFWSEDPTNPRYVPIRHRRYSDTPYRYGFQVELAPVNAPANGQFYVPGEGIDFRVNFRDGAGNLLHDANSLPSFAAFNADQVDSGLRYYDGFRNLLTLYYALKHREGNMLWNFQGPTDKLKQSHHLVPSNDLFTFADSQIDMATVPEDGYSAEFNLVPTAPFELDPFLSTLPVPNVIHVTVPNDALPGTYTMSIKGRRDWGGEALNRGVTVEVQVGQAAPTAFMPTTGHCNDCHKNQTGFANVLHGIDDRRACYGCHAALEFEPDHALDYRVHYIHTRSNRFPADPNKCSTCHLTPPTGPARGFPGSTPL